MSGKTGLVLTVTGLTLGAAFAGGADVTALLAQGGFGTTSVSFGITVVGLILSTVLCIIGVCMLKADTTERVDEWTYNSKR